MNFQNIISIIFFLSQLSFSQSSLEKKSLKVGDVAPSFKIAEWIKGNPVKVIEEGKVNIIEFTIVGCGPCIKAIPHLSELNAKYDDKINMVSVFANGKNVSAVKKLVNNYKTDVSYSVAIDTPEEFMKTNWMEAYSNGGGQAYPTVFVIDQKGLIAWVGNPLDNNFEDIVEQVHNSNFDKYTYLEEEKKKKEESRKKMNKYVVKAFENGTPKDLQDANHYLDSLSEIDARILNLKFKLWIKKDEDFAYQTLQKAFDEHVVDIYTLYDFMFAWPSLQRPNWNLFRKCAHYLYEVENKKQAGAGFLRFISESYYLERDLDSAITSQKLLISHLIKYNQDEHEWIEADKKTLDWFYREKQIEDIIKNSNYFSSIDRSINEFPVSLKSQPYQSVFQFNQKQNNIKGFKTMRSMPLKNLYLLAYFDIILPFSDKSENVQFIFDISNKDKLIQLFVSPNEYGSLFNYNLAISKDVYTYDSVKQIMQNDLNKAFGFTAQIIDGPVTVWKLKMDNNSLESLKGKTIKNEYTANITTEKISLKSTLYYLIKALNEIEPQEFYRHPIIDETGMNFPIELNINLDYKNGKLDIKALQNELKKHGFKLAKETIVMKALLIKDVNK